MIASRYSIDTSVALIWGSAATPSNVTEVMTSTAMP